MRHDKIVPGVILITIGLVFLLRSFGLVHIHWMNFLYLWPIFLLIGGINLIFANNRSPLASTLKIGIVMLGLGVILFGNFGNRYHFWPGYTYSSKDNDNDDDFNFDDNDSDNDSDSTHTDVVKIEGNSSFSEPFNAAVNIAKLNISGGGTGYFLSDTTSQLFEAYTKEQGASYELTRKNQDSIFVLNFDMKENNHFRLRKGKSNSATFKLSSAPVWDMDIQTGAAKLDFDLTKFKVRNFTISGGAAAFDVKVGEPLALTKIDISTGISAVKISVPKDAACKIMSDSGLSSNKFEGFNKTDDDHYETPGYAAAKNKIYIKLDGGISDFKVTRY